jgi:hypothetical protein
MQVTLHQCTARVTGRSGDKLAGEAATASSAIARRSQLFRKSHAAANSSNREAKAPVHGTSEANAENGVLPRWSARFLLALRPRGRTLRKRGRNRLRLASRGEEVASRQPVPLDDRKFARAGRKAGAIPRLNKCPKQRLKGPEQIKLRELYSGRRNRPERRTPQNAALPMGKRSRPGALRNSHFEYKRTEPTNPAPSVGSFRVPKPKRRPQFPWYGGPRL